MDIARSSRSRSPLCCCSRPLKPAVWLLIGYLVVPTVTFAITYTISALNGTLQYPRFYISSAIDFAPSMMIGALGFFITSVILTAIVIVRYYQMTTILRATAALVDSEVSVEDAPRKSSTNTDITQEAQQQLCARLARFNRWSLFSGSVCAFAFAGVGAFPYHEGAKAHDFWAATYLIFGLIWFYLQAYTTWAFAKHLPSSHLDARQQYKVALIRIAFSIIMTILFVVMQTCIFVLDLVAPASALELAIGVFWSVYYATYFPEFDLVSFSLYVDCEACPTSSGAKSPSCAADKVEGGAKTSTDSCELTGVSHSDSA